MKVEEIQKMKEDGKTIREIAKYYGCRAGKVSSFMKDNNIGVAARFKWNDEKDSILKEGKEKGFSREKIAQLLECTTSAVSSRITTLKLGNPAVKNKIILLETEIKDIKFRIKRGDTQKDIAAAFNMSIPALTRKLKKWGTSTKKYKVKHDYFTNIDTEEKAYFLGFLYADGYNSLSKNQIKLKLLTKDKYIIEKFAKALTEGEALPPISEEKGTNCSVIQLYSKTLCLDLEALGCGQAKAFSVKFPIFLNTELLRHFIRGYFDGDGSIFRQVRGKSQLPFTSINFTGYSDFIKDLRNYLVSTLGLSKVTLGSLTDKGTVQVTFTSYKDIALLRDYFYLNSDPTLRLSRKFDKFLSDKEIAAAKQKGKDITQKYHDLIVVNTDNHTTKHYSSVNKVADALGVDIQTIYKAMNHANTVSKKYKVISASI